MKNKTKYYLTIALLLCVARVQAAYNKNEFYCGLDSGVSYVYGKRSEVNDNNNILSNNAKYSKTAPYNGLYVGYFHRIQNRFAFAVEPFIAYTPFSSSKQASIDIGGAFFDYNSEIKSDSNVTAGAILKLGLIVDEDWFIYALIGGETKDIRYTTTFSNGLLQQGNGSATKRLWGIQYGLGVERAILNHWRLGAEIKNTHYQNADLKVLSSADPSQFVKNQMKMNALYVGIKLSYVF